MLSITPVRRSARAAAAVGRRRVAEARGERALALLDDGGRAEAAASRSLKARLIFRAERRRRSTDRTDRITARGSGRREEARSRSSLASGLASARGF
jgi:hypothetical protein